MFIIFYLLICLLVGVLGSRTMIGFWGFFFLSFFLSPIIALAVVLISTPRKIPGHTIKETLVKLEVKEP